jgi:hypothetical protein
LDPTHAFATRLALAGSNTLTGLRAGDVIEVRLFTNRLNAVHSWSAAFESAPDDSASTLDNAIGSAATYPGTFQIGADPTYSTIRFKADRAGVYRVRVSTELQGGDPLGLPVTVSTQEIVAEVGEGAGDESGGCASTHAQASLMALLAALGLAAGLRWRRG